MQYFNPQHFNPGDIVSFSDFGDNEAIGIVIEKLQNYNNAYCVMFDKKWSIYTHYCDDLIIDSRGYYCLAKNLKLISKRKSDISFNIGDLVFLQKERMFGIINSVLMNRKTKNKKFGITITYPKRNYKLNIESEAKNIILIEKSKNCIVGRRKRKIADLLG
jgi:hypothetical protein